MDFEIDWTEGAIQDFEDAVRYVARHNGSAADQLRMDLLDSVETLARFPFIGPVYERDRVVTERSAAGAIGSSTVWPKPFVESRFW